MRVSHVITRLIVGGAQENTVASVLGLRAKPGFEVDLISGPTRGREGSLEPLFDSHPGSLTILPSLVRPVHPWADFRAYRELTALFRKWRPAMVHTHSGKAGVLGRLAARRAGVPLIVHTIHGPSFGEFQGTMANALFTQAERWAGRVTDHFVVVANAMTHQYLAAGIGRPEQYSRVFSGFDLDPFLNARRDPELANRLGLKPGDFVVGKIARLWKLKGHEDIIATAAAVVAKVPSARFLFVGDGPWRERLESRTRELGLTSHFIFTGLIPPTEVPRYVGLMDVLVHLSRREGLPRALPQAMAAGKPVLAYDCDGAGEVCLENQTGHLIPVGQAEDLVEWLPRLHGDPELRRRWGEQGRAFVAARFGVQSMVDELEKLYRRLAASRGLPAIPSA